MSGGVPAGWVLVPVEPTMEMYEAGYDATRLADGTPQFANAGFYLGHSGNIYRAMIAATPTPPIESWDADVERVEIVAKAIYDATHVGLSNCYAWDDEWEPCQEACRGRYYKEAAAAIAALQALGERG